MNQASFQSLFDIAEQALRENPGWLDELVDTDTAAMTVNEAPATLATKRSRGGGPPFVKHGAKVSYRRRALFEYVISRERASTSDPGPKVAA
jgi:hypothetical protein